MLQVSVHSSSVMYIHLNFPPRVHLHQSVAVLAVGLCFVGKVVNQLIVVYSTLPALAPLYTQYNQYSDWPAWLRVDGLLVSHSHKAEMDGENKQHASFTLEECVTAKWRYTSMHLSLCCIHTCDCSPNDYRHWLVAFLRVPWLHKSQTIDLSQADSGF